MKKLCFIGNSHLAALKLAWDDIQENHPDLDITFFGAYGNSLANIAVEDGALVPTNEKMQLEFNVTSYDKGRITISEYDYFFLFSLNFSVNLIIPPYDEFRTDSQQDDPAKHLISDRFYKDISKDFLTQSAGYVVRQKLIEAGAAQIFISPQPMPSEAILQNKNGASTFRDAHDNGDLPAIVDMFEDIKAEFAEEGLAYVDQPSDTLNPNGFTKDMYSVDAIRLTIKFNKKHPPDDHFHMNTHYGAALLQKIFAII